ncbi:Gfo/Idh/MocA family protein [Acinetobacter sichuanensis]|uniref:Gfo/Idh/MocA family oxidoreductase n=1 Tax=Acinetobacter sichuanensis TaxID=2136183 RepID=A0A371YPQ0_9GAMM|nr:Gfo/Idh/MocA family oxidoreductase [Acinetobacter sichuanensis]RFC83412.1 gfo/Idh/MocA family oxidoreductase [Acinetobacter sichuanensis]
MVKQKIRCILLGLGNQGCEHLAAAIDHPDVEIVAGVDSSTERHTLIAKQFPMLNLTFFSQLEDIVSSGFIFDALILALPHHAYEPIWHKLLDLQKPMLKEKPLGRDYQEAKYFMQSAKLAKCGLRTAIQRRNHASYKFLFDYLKQHHLTVTELHAHLHLGKSGKKSTSTEHNWREDRRYAGGGALLDAGYHLIDLIQFLVGDFDVISSTMWNGQQADNGKDIEDRCWFTGRSAQTWIMLDTWVKGESDLQGGYIKSEQVLLQTSQGILRANREGVWCNNEQLFSSAKDWSNAMQKQLSHFAQNIDYNTWYDDLILDQLPAMRKIEEAYRLSSRY